MPYAVKMEECRQCEFYQLVATEEGAAYKVAAATEDAAAVEAGVITEEGAVVAGAAATEDEAVAGAAVVTPADEDEEENKE